jgi:hypothetical protein
MYVDLSAPTRLAGLALVAAAALTACAATAGSEPGVATLPTSPPGVATLERAAPDAASSPWPSAGPADGQEAFLDFAQCIRDNGIGMPDPQFDADGRFRIGGPGAGDVMVDFESDEFQAAQDACDQHLEGLGANLDPEQQAERQEALVEFATCMREQGIDMPDPQVGSGGGAMMMIGGPDSDVDPGSPEFQAAMEECQPALGEGPVGRRAP